MQSTSVPFHHIFRHAPPPPPATTWPPQSQASSCHHRILDVLSAHQSMQSAFPPRPTENHISPSNMYGPVPDASVNEYTIDEAVALVLSVLPYVHENAVRARCLDLISDFGGAHRDSSAIADEVISLMLTV